MGKRRIITMGNIEKEKTLAELIPTFLASKKAEGVSPKTLESYKNCFHSLQRFFSLDILCSDFTQAEVNEIIGRLVDGRKLDGSKIELSGATVATYCRNLAPLVTFAVANGYLHDVHVPRYHYEESPKVVYTNEEVKALIKKPDLKKCDFGEYRTWVIICFLLNCGCRAATIRNIKIKDIDFDGGMVVFRHNKNGKVQYAPMCNELQKTLKEYLRYRGGGAEDWLFPSQDNGQITESGLRSSVERYNKARGVQKTSIHLFRHYFAKTYIQSGGDCFRLQKILGHSSLEMTEHYVNLYSQDTLRGFEDLSPLAQLSKSQRIKIR